MPPMRYAGRSAGMDSNFAEVAARLKAADEALIPLARRNIRAATAPVGEAIRREALATLPKSGGANEWVAASKITTTTSLVPRTAGVTLRVHAQNEAVAAKRSRARSAGKKYGGSASHNLQAINRGGLRHPLYGNRDHWYTTRVKPGFFDRPVRAAVPAVAEACLAALREAVAVAGFK